MQWGRRKRRMWAERLEERRCLATYGFAEHLVVDPIVVQRSSILADLDGDGDDDLVTDGKWRENVDGAFGPTHRYATPHENHYAIESGDLDGDGDLDLVAFGRFDAGYQVDGSSELVWYENRNGVGQFGPRQTIVVFENGQGVPTLLIGNVDHDEAEEVFVLNSRAPADSIRRYDYDGAGTVIDSGTPLEVGRFGITRLLDVDGDGDADLIRGNDWLENQDGVGGFVNRGSYFDAALGHLTPIELADFNDDGLPDLALAGRWSLTLLIGTPVWGDFVTGPTIETTDNVGFVATAIRDFNGDGEFDVAALMTNDAADAQYDIRWFPQINGEFGNATMLLAPNFRWNNAFLSTDINNDGHVDLIYDGMTQLFSPDDNEFAPSHSLDPPSSDYVLKVVDVDRDGDLDLVTSVQRTDCFFEVMYECELSFYWRENLDGNGDYSPEPHWIGSPRVIGELTFNDVTDVDGDGDADLLYEFRTDGRYETFWFQRTDDNQYFSEAMQLGTFDAPLELIADIDGDGKADLIRRSPTQLLVDRVGDETHNAVPFASVDSTISDILAVDWDEDRDIDIVARRNARLSELEVVVFKNDGSEFAPAELVLSNRERLFSQFGRLFVVDLVGDSRNELVFKHHRSDVQLFVRDGDTNWNSSILVESSTATLFFVDIDQDARLDFVYSALGGVNSVHFNQGQGQFRTQAIARQFVSPRLAADVDGDGDLDLIYSGSMWSETRVIGDANGDGVFDSADLVVVMQAGVYEDDLPLNAVFQQGDWNGDGEFTSADLVYAFQLGIASAG